MAEDETERGRPGIPVDSYGGATIDPTKNVLDLVKAAVKRQDDVLTEIIRRVDAQVVATKELLQLEREHAREMLTSYDRRYEQRHEASQKALDTALTAQKDAVKDAFSAQKEAINAALASADRAVSKAEVAAEKRFEGVNEFRAQLGDQQRTLMPRAEAEKTFNTLETSVRVLEGFRTEVLSRGTGAREGYGLAIGVVGVIVAVIGIISGIAGLVIAFGKFGP